MGLQQRREDHAALSLLDNCVYLAMDGSARSYAKTADFLGNAGKDPALTHGRMLALYHVNGPQDVHYPIWEMHPDGDELLILASGSLSVEFREGETKRTAPLPPQAAFIVPAGIWHRIIVDEPSVLLVVTPRHNTMHENG